MCQCELTKFFAELTEFAQKLSEFSSEPCSTLETVLRPCPRILLKSPRSSGKFSQRLRVASGACWVLLLSGTKNWLREHFVPDWALARCRPVLRGAYSLQPQQRFEWLMALRFESFDLKSGKSRWGLDEWGLKALVHKFPRLPTIVAFCDESSPRSYCPKGHKCTQLQSIVHKSPIVAVSPHLRVPIDTFPMRSL